MTVNRKDVAAGSFFVAVALLYGGLAWVRLPIGHALNMGPGYFPIMLSVLLAGLGTLTLVRGLFAEQPGTPFGIVPWRAIAMLAAGMLFFALFLRQLGLFPAVAGAAMIASFSSPQIGLRTAAVVSLALAAFCVGVFHFGLGITVPVFGNWFPH